MIKFFTGNCLTRLPRKLARQPSKTRRPGARAGRVDYGSLWKNHKRFDLRMKHPRKTKTFINSPSGFFHYEPLSASFFRKNLIIPEAVILSKSQSVTHVL